MNPKLRVMIADDERPARSFLAALLRSFDYVEIVGEAEDGVQAVEIIERKRPDLALLDLQMPELDGLGVIRLVRKSRMPLVAFVTAYDEYAVKAFEMNAVDYLLKPIDRPRLADTLQRAQDRLEQADLRREDMAHIQKAATSYEAKGGKVYVERIPVRQQDEVILLPVRDIASIEADGEVLNITTVRKETHSINYRLKDLEARLDPSQFVRLSRGSLARLELITRVTAMPGGTCVVTLKNDQRLPVSRIQSRILREQLLRL
jgi:two-component system, LytTR family, response regulator